MKRINYTKWLIISLAVLTLSSCEVIGGIFQAGVWVGIIIVVLIIILVIWLIRKMMD